MAFAPKNPNNKMVMGRLAHGLASRNDITEGTDAPFLLNSIDMASIPWEHAEARNPKITE